MPIPVGCQCGKRFQAKDEMAGKRVKCPGCGNVLTIPELQPAAIGGIDDMFGPGGGDPLFHSGPLGPAGAAGSGIPGSAGPPRARRRKGPNLVLIAGIAGGAVGVLLILIVVLVVAFGGRKDGNLAANSAPAPVAAPPSTAAVPTSDSTAPPPPSGNAPPVEVTTPPAPPVAASTTPDGDDETAAAETTPGPEGGSADSGDRKSIATALAAWHVKADDKYRGSFPAEEDKDEDFIVYHYSWMTQLLPYMGYEKIHKRIDFKKPWTTKGNNVYAAQYRIPQFLNPSDDRKAWKGYQFSNMGLTHFVGMSGVEETRQEVAATLDRSHERAGIFGYEGVAKESDITDGKNQTIMLIGSGELIGPWILGGGATVRGARAPHVDEASGEKKFDYFNAMDGYGSRGQSGALTLMADGSARVLSADMDPALFRALCTTHGKETVDLAKAGKTLDKFPTQDFDPFKDETEITVTIVKRIGDGGGGDDDDSDSDDKSDGDSDNSNDDSGSDE